MGNYATTTQLIARFESSAALSYLTDSEDTGAADTTVLDEVIDDAEGVINSYLGERYRVPVDVATYTTVAPRLKSLTLDLAVWRLLVRGDRASEVKRMAHDDAIAYLEKLANGELTLPSTATLPVTGSEGEGAAWGTSGAAVSGTTRRLFDRGTQDSL